MAKTRKRGGLTKAQWELLCEIVDGRCTSVVEGYPPRYKLDALGLVKFVTRRWGNDFITATPAGRKLVEDVRRMERE